ncbi:MAG: glutamine-hydrolyzing GMP synthase [Planctomycetota bacterium]
MKDNRGVLVVDLGTQYAQLIARRVREAQVWSEIAPAKRCLEVAKDMDLAGVILSGGPASVYADDAPEIPREVLELGVPVLGICYGMQWMSQTLGGHVEAAERREFGRTSMRILDPSGPFVGVQGHTVVWMSHGDQVSRLPQGFAVLAESDTCPFAAIGDHDRGFYGIQFHPEVTHSVRGREVIENFLYRVCGLEGDWTPHNIVEHQVAKVRELVGRDGEVVMGLSGGVDSSVAAMILHQAIGDRLHCIFVDNGLLRKDEAAGVGRLFGEHLHMDLTMVDAGERFLTKLAGVTDPERKRKIIGHEFVEVFREQARRFENAHFLGQGTLYPDVIESVAAHGGNTAVIKSHHNVGGLPEDLEMTLVEPLRELFKDEVRAIGHNLGLPSSLVDRQPFPGPGLAVRIWSDITPENVALPGRPTRRARGDRGGGRAAQPVAVLRGVAARALRRRHGRRAPTNRPVRCESSSPSTMTADWAYLDRELIARISNRVIRQVRGIQPRRPRRLEQAARDDRVG